MLGKFLFTTEQGTILLASIIISTSILIAGGNFKVKDPAQQNNGNVQVQALQPGSLRGDSVEPGQAPSQALAAAQPGTKKPVKVSIAGSPVLGDKNAKLTLVEFSDYECPFCKKSFTELLPELKKEYIDSGKVRLVYKNLPLPFHQNAVKEAEAALCAKDQGGDTAYFKYHDQIFTKTSGGGTGITLDQLPVIAEDLGLKVTVFQKCLDSGKFKPQVDEDIAEAGKVGASGTPTWFLGRNVSPDSVDGEIMVGAQPFSSFKSAIDQQLSQI